MYMVSCKDVAEMWNITDRAVSGLCKEGKIPGAVKVGRDWQIPADAEKPVDKRVKSGAYRKKSISTLSMPIGISDYKKAQADYYYVDKTLMIRDVLDRKAQVSLFTRPRRFGKTLNMDMLRIFFEISEEDTSVYFRDKKIWNCGDGYLSHQGKYPVIFLTFKDVKFDSWTATLDKIAILLQAEFGRHKELFESGVLADFEREYVEKIMSGSASEVELSSSLENLSRMLHAYHKTAPIIIIDEYDTPIQAGYSQDYYEKIAGFMRNFFSGGFMDNPHLSFGFLTGILRIAQESIFSGLNNLDVNSVLDDEFSQYFGFTAREVRDMLAAYNVRNSYGELCEWYDGYLFGSTEIFNPWSVISYISKKCTPQAYWVNTGRNEILNHLIRCGAVKRSSAEKIAESLYAKDQAKLQNALAEYLDGTISYYDAAEESFFHGLTAGMLALMDDQYKITSNRESGDGRFDISLYPRTKQLPGILIEVKYDKALSEENLERRAKEALNQINKKRYDAEMKNDGITNIVKYGIAFSGKRVRIISE